MHFKKCLIVLFLLFLGVINVNAQGATASAAASAEIVVPITLTQTADMSFGNISAESGGTVVLAPAGTRTKSGGVILPATNGTVSAAAFTVAGASGFTYAITLPSSIIITHTDNTTTMNVSSITSSPSVTGVLSSGSQTLSVGGTLTVSNAQKAGIYSGSFDVTVAYN